ncbi:MAG: lipopolysaccharide biosynthesis protein, partial [Bdellovibrio sp. CG10_big_fil_rev_8_21_14_0_10_47_8]
MKILVVELARLGDIYQSWPALRALRRRHPDAQIDVITRPRFQAAFDGLEVVDRRRIFNTQELMGPLFAANMDVKASFDLVSRVLGEIKFEKYDWIINLSFSPLSSYITHAVAAESTRVSGYTRTSDGFLAIPDDLSAYFYAQVGFDRPNRFHLAEIFATMMEMDLIETDWTAPQGLITHSAAPPVLIHIGASEAKKQIGASKWATIINQLTKISDVRIGLIGSAAETENADSILNSVPADRVQNYVGKTNLTELFSLIAGAKLVVGPDSAPMHMASLVRTPCLNLSFHSVNFWETGPRAPGSYVLRGADESDFASDKVAHAIHLFFTGEKQDISLI